MNHTTTTTRGVIYKTESPIHVGDIWINNRRQPVKVMAVLRDEHYFDRQGRPHDATLFVAVSMAKTAVC